MINLSNTNVNWNVVSAIGSLLGSIATLGTVIIALYPYLKRGKLYFTTCSNIENGPVLSIINNKPEGILLEKVCFFAGPTIFKKCFYIDNFLEHEDDLVSDKTNNFIDPYTKKQINYNATRIIHDLSHHGLNIKWFTQRNVRIVVYTNTGRIKINTKIKAEHFIKIMISLSKVYNHYDVKEFIRLYCFK